MPVMENDATHFTLSGGTPGDADPLNPETGQPPL